MGSGCFGAWCGVTSAVAEHCEQDVAAAAPGEGARARLPLEGWSPRIDVPERQFAGGQAGVGNEVAGGLEFLAGDPRDDACFRTDPNCRDGNQDEEKRAGLDKDLKLSEEFSSGRESRAVTLLEPALRSFSGDWNLISNSAMAG